MFVEVIHFQVGVVLKKRYITLPFSLLLADVKEYPNLIKTLSFLLKSYEPKVNAAVTQSDNKHNGGIFISSFLKSMFTIVDQLVESLVSFLRQIHVPGCRGLHF